MTDDLWASASQDTEQENHDRAFTALRMQASKFWPILASAYDAKDFDNRYEVIGDKLDVMTATVAGGNPAVYTTLATELRDEFIKDFHTAMTKTAAKASVHKGWHGFDVHCAGCGLEPMRGLTYDGAHDMAETHNARHHADSTASGARLPIMEHQPGGGPSRVSPDYVDHSIDASKHTANQYIKQQGDSWVITQKGTGKVLSHHSSQEQAEKAFAAMESNMHGGSKTADSHYEDGLGCPYCKWTGSKLEDRKKHIEDKHPGKPSGFSLGAKDDTDDDDFPELDMGLDAVDKAQDKKGSKESDIDPWDPGAEGGAYDEHKESLLAFNPLDNDDEGDDDSKQAKVPSSGKHPWLEKELGMEPAAKTSGAHVPQWGPTTADPNFFAAPATSQDNNPAPAPETPGSNPQQVSTAHPDQDLDEAPEPNPIDKSVVVSKRWVDANKSFYEVSSSRHVAEEGVHQDSLWGDNGYDYWKYFNENPPGHNRSDDEKPISDNQREQWSKEVNK